MKKIWNICVREHCYQSHVMCPLILNFHQRFSYVTIYFYLLSLLNRRDLQVVLEHHGVFGFYFNGNLCPPQTNTNQLSTSHQYHDIKLQGPLPPLQFDPQLEPSLETKHILQSSLRLAELGPLLHQFSEGIREHHAPLCF